MVYQTRFQLPENGWWVYATYDEDTYKLLIKPLEDIKDKTFFKDTGVTSLPKNLNEEANSQYQYAKNWCEEHSRKMRSRNEAELYLQHNAKSLNIHFSVMTQGR